MVAFGRLGSAFEIHGSPLPVNTYIYLQNFKTITAHISKYCMQILPCIDSDSDSDSWFVARLQATPTPALTPTPHPWWVHIWYLPYIHFQIGSIFEIR